MGDVICFQHARDTRRSRALYAEAETCRAAGDEGGVDHAVSIARIIDEFGLGVDTGMDAEMRRACLEPMSGWPLAD